MAQSKLSQCLDNMENDLIYGNDFELKVNCHPLDLIFSGFKDPSRYKDLSYKYLDLMLKIKNTNNIVLKWYLKRKANKILSILKKAEASISRFHRPTGNYKTVLSNGAN